MNTDSTPHAPQRLWLAVSGHGHGHLVQINPLIAEMRARYPRLHIAVQSELPAELVYQTLGEDIVLYRQAGDVGMIMSGPLKVLPDESLDAHRKFHENWKERLAWQKALYEQFRPDLVIGDIPYLPLAAAVEKGITAVAVCSLNWADILDHYCGSDARAPAIIEQIRSCYASADMFLRPAPAMPMPTLSNAIAIGPLVPTGTCRREELQRQLGVSADVRIILMTLGGIPGTLELGGWRAIEDTVFLVPQSWLASATGKIVPGRFIALETLGLSMTDLFASCDAVVTKPGYGSFAGAACASLPLLYVSRHDWPEEPVLVDWLDRHGRVTRIDWSMLSSGRLTHELDALLALPEKPAVEASGAVQGVTLIERLLQGRSVRHAS